MWDVYMTALVYMKENVIHCMAIVHVMLVGLVPTVRKSAKKDIMVWTVRIDVGVRMEGLATMFLVHAVVLQVGLAPCVKNLVQKELMALPAATSASARMEGTVIQSLANVDVHQGGLVMFVPTHVHREHGVLTAQNSVTVIILQHVTT